MISRDELSKRLWPEGTFVDFNLGLNKAVNRLREALDDSAEQPTFIETFPKRGYRFMAPVSRNGAGPLEESPKFPAEGLHKSPDFVHEDENRAVPAGSVRGRLAAVAAVLTIIVIVVAGSYFAWRRYSKTPVPPGRIMMAVLPFQNLTGDPEQERS